MSIKMVFYLILVIVLEFIFSQNSATSLDMKIKTGCIRWGKTKYLRFPVLMQRRKFDLVELRDLVRHYGEFLGERSE